MTQLHPNFTGIWINDVSWCGHFEYIISSTWVCLFRSGRGEKKQQREFLCFFHENRGWSRSKCKWSQTRIYMDTINACYRNGEERRNMCETVQQHHHKLGKYEQPTFSFSSLRSRLRIELMINSPNPSPTPLESYCRDNTAGTWLDKQCAVLSYFSGVMIVDRRNKHH